MLKKYVYIILLDIASFAVMFLPTGVYVYGKFGFTSSAVTTGTKVSLITIFFFAVAGICMFSMIKNKLKQIKNWKLQYILQTVYYLALAAAFVFLINKACSAVDAVVANSLKSVSTVQDVTAAIVYSAILFLGSFIISRVITFFASWLRSQVADRETLKSVARANKALDKEKVKKVKKVKKSKEVYLNE